MEEDYMLCPHCHEENMENALYCHYCGKDLEVRSTSLVTTANRLPTMLQNPQIPRVAAGVGAVAVGVGLELLRRGLLSKAAHPSRAVSNTMPLVNRMKDVLFPQNEKQYKLPKNYEIEETIVYIQRVIRRKD
jgi:hypothetical protein